MAYCKARQGCYVMTRRLFLPFEAHDGWMAVDGLSSSRSGHSEVVAEGLDVWAASWGECAPEMSASWASMLRAAGVPRCDGPASALDIRWCAVVSIASISFFPPRSRTATRFASTSQLEAARLGAFMPRATRFSE
jgi:hypothetical protein